MSAYQPRVDRVLLWLRGALGAALIIAAGFGDLRTALGVDSQGVLLLRNGQTLEGRVRSTEDGYLVVVPGGLIRVKRFEVLAVCRDLREVYQYKLHLIRLDSAQDRLTLAQWCHQVGLHQEAHRELEAAAALDPTHPLIPVLTRQLRTSPLIAGEAPASGPIAAGPSTYELDLMVRGMPPGTVESFAQTIQPLLVNRCGAAGCHGQGSPSGFRLLRMPPGGPPSRRLTQRNLYATLQWVDRLRPEQSPLLTVPIRPHGTARAPIFADHQLSQYRQLVDWCCRVARAEPSIAQASFQQPLDGAQLAGPKRSTHRRHPETGMGKGRSDVVPAVATQQAPGESGAAAGESRESAKTNRGLTTKPKFAPTDPFDPEVFNRQVWPEGERPVGEGSTTPSHRPAEPAEDRTSPRPGSMRGGPSAQQPYEGPADPPLPAAPLEP